MNTIAQHIEQKWLARGCIAALIAMVVYLRLFGFGVVVSETRGETIYRSTLSITIVSVIFGVIICAVGILYSRQSNRLFKLIGATLLLTGLGVALALAPTPLIHRFVLSNDGFEDVTGYWFAPKKSAVTYQSLAYVQFSREDSETSERLHFQLECIGKDGRATVVHINDMMKMALPRIINHLNNRDIMILDSPEGWRIPPDLAQYMNNEQVTNEKWDH